jgi:hypothetical protein
MKSSNEKISSEKIREIEYQQNEINNSANSENNFE